MGLFGNKERKYWRRYEEAFRYYENRQITRAIKSVMNPAADGFAPAQHLMGILRIERELYDDAEYWLTNALKNGHTQAQADLNYLHNEVLKKKEQAAAKDRKALLDNIEMYISTIARQGRAFGIHLVLATQRPDANILSGQIKNNLDCRVCGKADTTLSTIVVGDGKAHEAIPKDSQGRFINQNGTVFQGFYFDY